MYQVNLRSLRIFDCISLFISFYLMNTARNLEQIENEIDKEEKLMSIHKTNGNYADAEVSRLKIEQLCKDHEARALYEMQLRHKQQQKHLLDSNHQEYVAFNSFWNKREAEIKQQEQKSESEMMVRHKSEQSQTRKELQVLNSPKVKESSQLLNLRKMQEHMVKQKNFAEAHKVQAQIFQMQKVQKQAWLSKRDEKIETALNTLKGKQNVQFTNLKKRFKTLLDESMTERKLQEERLLLKHNNLLKDLKSQQQKELLNQKGEFKSKGGKESPMRTKSSIHA